MIDDIAFGILVIGAIVGVVITISGLAIIYHRWKAPKLPPKPAREEGFDWIWLSAGCSDTAGMWIEVCDFCGGNCGQCSLGHRIGNIPVDMNWMIRSIHKHANAGIFKTKAR